MHLNQSLAGAFATFGRQIAGDIHTDVLRRYLLATDASIFCKPPLAVVYPRTTADVRALVRFAGEHGLAVHPRGAGSGLCGSAVGDGIVVDFTRHMHRLIRLDPGEGWFECQPGYRLGELNAALVDTGLWFPPDPSSGEYATFGGMYATNASGAHSVKYGNVADYLLDARVVLSDGSARWLSQWEDAAVGELPDGLRRLAGLYRDNASTIEAAYPLIACNVAGYNLRGLVRDGHLHLHRLLAGAEGTLGVVTRLKFRLRPRPGADALVVAYFDDIGPAAEAVQLAMPLKPAGIEIMDKSLLGLARGAEPNLRGRIPAGVDNVLLMAFDGDEMEACAGPAAEMQRLLRDHGLTDRAYLAATEEEKDAFWALRKAAVPILYKLKGRRKILALVEDAAVPTQQLAAYFEGIYAIFARHGVEFVLYGHIAKGLMHTRPLLDLKDAHDVNLLQPIADDVYELVDRLGGTVSGEHGDGRLRSAYIRRKYPEIYPLFDRAKELLDPRRMFNPDIKKSIDPAQMTRDLRFGPQYRVVSPVALRLQWPETLAAEAEMCHGCSRCTIVTAATRMCPVYKVTRDEAATPKAKANLLRALISGAIESRALYADGFAHVMAQCINCGSCYHECPSNVNIPKLAMEAKAQYVRRFGTPLPEWLTANVELAARGLHRLAPLADRALRVPGVCRLASRLGGLAPEREMVRFARRSLYRRRPGLIPGKGPSVLFFAGCYAAYIRPELGEAAMDVLAHMGCRVHLPRQFCCGLPQLSKGMSLAARRKVRRNLNAWQDLIQGVDHIVVTCSSCGFALIQDWHYLLPDAALAERISAKTIHISRLLNRHPMRLSLADLPVRLAYHSPCHLRIQPDSDSSLALLSAMPGVTVRDLNSHCCGMAGSWGLLRRHHALSRTIGGPMIRRLNASRADFGVTDCPTCQMQMEYMGRLEVRHPIEIVRKGLAPDRRKD